MIYEVTATKKRPQTLNAIIDQEFVVTTLKSSIEQGRIAHAYLFSGPRGVGKTSAARILAKALNCETGLTPNPCGKCSTCEEISKGISLDVIEIDGASNTSINDVREIKDEVLFAPNVCRYKVYIIDEVHMLSNSAFNALLKTIEEPPPYIVFIFATTEIHKVPATIRSRCQQFNFKLISITKIKETLQKESDDAGIIAEENALFWIAKESTGSLRDAFTLYDQIVSFSENNITLDKIKEKLGIIGIDELNTMCEYLSTGDSKNILEFLDDILYKGIAIEQLIIEFVEYFRNILFIKHEIKKENILTYPLENFSKIVLNNYSIFQLEITIELLLELYKNIKYSFNQRYELELTLIRLSKSSQIISTEDILNKINDLKKFLLNSNQNEYVEVREAPTTPEASDNSKETITENENNTTNTQKDLLREIIQLLYKNKKLTLASSLEKVNSWEIANNELSLNFNMKDKFSGELIKREKKIMLDIIALIIPDPIILKINFISFSTETEHKKDERLEILKEIFNGEIVQGE